MRDVDYKVWEISEKRFVGWYELYDGMVHVAIGDQYYLINNLNSSEEHKAKLTAKGIEIRDEFILCQFTGLRDKNGNKIYEDDLVSDGAKVWTIKQLTGGAWAMDYANGSGECYLYPINKHVEIVGNIYESNTNGKPE